MLIDQAQHRFSKKNTHTHTHTCDWNRLPGRPLKQILLVKLVVNDFFRWPGTTRTTITSHTPFKAPTFLDQAFIIKTPHVVIELTVSCMEVRSGLT